jgi:hypothetical protein
MLRRTYMIGYRSKKVGGLVGYRRPCAFTEADVKRAIRAVRAAGEVPGRVLIDTRTGIVTVEVVTGSPSSPGKVPNPWDEDE